MDVEFGERHVPAIDKDGETVEAPSNTDETDATASTSAVSASEASDITPAKKNITPVKIYRAPSPPRWRFVKEAKKTTGYSSTAAGVVVRGTSSEELGASYIPPHITFLEKVQKKNVGELSVPEIRYSEFQKDQREVGQLSFGESPPEYEELYEGGCTISHDPKDALQLDKHSRQWANYQPRTKGSKESRNDTKDKWTNIIHEEDIPQRKYEEVGKLMFCPDDYLEEPFEGEFPRRKIDNAIVTGDGAAVQDINESSPTDVSSTTNGSGRQKEETSMEDEEHPSVYDDGGDDDDDELSKSIGESDSTADPRRRNMFLLLLLIPLLIAGAIIAVVLGKKKSPSDENTRVISSVVMLQPNITIQPSAFPSANPSHFYSSGSFNLFQEGAGLQNTTMKPSTFPSANPSHFLSHGLFRPPASTPPPVSTIDLYLSTFPTATPLEQSSATPSDAPFQLQSVPTGSTSLFGSTYQPSIEPRSPPISTMTPTTYIPTLLPAQSPSVQPSQSPTSSSSNRPTQMPTDPPSVKPSQSPTSPPLNRPTLLPTDLPSVKPSRPPTNPPSDSPVTLSPSTKPSQSPTNSPSNRPVALSPTRQPVVFLGGCPKLFVPISYYGIGMQVQSQGIVYECTSYSCGTFGYDPGSTTGLWEEGWKIVGSCSGTTAPTTSRPTPTPTRPPSVQPSRFPYKAPSIAPTEKPTTSPSKRPSQFPTSPPSKTPSGQPTQLPTPEPTPNPTPEPTFEPKISPTLEPTPNPTLEPTFEPKISPTLEPTPNPTLEPTFEPKISPTLEPTPMPTLEPMFEPTITPTLEPTTNPTLEPTPLPTLEPTSKPTQQPTTKPTLQPTQLDPTKKPTEVPTLTPTCAENGNFNLCLAIDMSGSVCNGDLSGLCLDCFSETISCNSGGDCFSETIPCNSGGEKLSICCPNFSNMLEFTKDLITDLGELPTDQDFSIVHFGTDVTVASTLESWRQSINTINQLKYTGGYTNLAGAILSCQLTLDQSPPDRKNLMLIITDGAPSVPQPVANAKGAATTAALNARNQDTFIIPVLIEEPNTNDQDEVLFLKNNISSDGKVFVSDFDGLKNLQDSLFEQVTCQANANDIYTGE